MTKKHCNQFRLSKQARLFTGKRLIYLDFDIYKSDNNAGSNSKIELTSTKLDDAKKVENREKSMLVNGVPIDATDATDEPTTPTSQKTSETADKKDNPQSNSPEKKEQMTGGEFMASLKGKNREEREQAIYEMAVSDNVPESLKQLKAVEVSTVGPDGVVHTGKIFVMPDYFSIGTDGDSVRVPMDPRTAKAIADHYGCVLPTKKMVQQISLNADLNVDLVTYNSIAGSLGVKQMKANESPDGTKMMSNAFYEENSRMTDQKLQEAGYKTGQIIAGIKKDIVITNRLLEKKNRVAIYGASKNNGKDSIQPLSTVHEDAYADYSHGARLVYGKMEVDGQMIDIGKVLEDPVLCKLISDEGTIQQYKDFYKTQDRFKSYTPRPNAFGIPGRAPEKPSQSISSASNTPTKENSSVSSSSQETASAETKPVTTPNGGTTAEVSSSSTKAEESAVTTDSENEEEVTDDEAEDTAVPAVVPPKHQVFSGASKSAPSFTPYTSTAPAGFFSEVSSRDTTAESTSASKSKSVDVPKPPTAQENRETLSTTTLTVVGDSLSDGGASAAKKAGINALPQYLPGKSELKGQFTTDALNTIKSMPAEEGKTVLLTIGTNDLFSKRSVDEMIKTWKETVDIAVNEKKFKLIVGTVPPLGGSIYNTNYNEEDLTSRWETFNNFILSEGSKLGISQIIPFHTLLADPNNPKRLNPSVRAEDGLHMKDYGPMGEAIANALRTEANGNSDQKPPELDQQSAKPETSIAANQDSPETTPDQKKNLLGFEDKEGFPEQILTYFFPPDDPKPLRVHINAPKNFDPNNAIITFYTLPEGNSIEQTEGRQEKPGRDWHYNIQHIGAQARELREASTEKSRVMVYVEGPNLSLINYLRQDRTLKGKRFEELMENVKAKLNAPNADIDIAGHSGGGSLKLAYLESVDKIPDSIKRISFKDSNYSCNVGHVQKMSEWLKNTNDHYLNVIVYDDTNVKVKDSKTGKMKPLGASSYKKAKEMMENFKENGIPLTEVSQPETAGYTKFTALEGRINFLMLANPDNKILHTRIVELNGFEYAETAGTPFEKKVGQFNGPINYQKFIEA